MLITKREKRQEERERKGEIITVEGNKRLEDRKRGGPIRGWRNDRWD